MSIVTNGEKIDFRLSDLAYVIEGAVSEDVCDKLISFYEKNTEKEVREQSSNTMTQQIEVSTFTCITPDDNSDEAKMCISLIRDAVLKWCDYLHQFNMFDTSELVCMTSNITHYRVMKYENGASIHPHTDVGFTGIGSVNRASCTINLSKEDEYDGGIFALLNRQKLIKLGKGDILIFPASSFWVHEVTPVTSGCRYSINGFLGTEVFSQG